MAYQFDNPKHRRRAFQIRHEMQVYFGDLLQRRTYRLRPGLILDLIDAESNGLLTRAEIITICEEILVAGHETTAYQLGNCLKVLADHESIYRKYDNTEITSAAIEELCRFEPAIQATSRIAREDLDFDTHRVRAGEQVVLLLGSANRDPEQFTHPDTCDIHRRPNRHLTFGLGSWSHWQVSRAGSRCKRPFNSS